MAKKKNNEDIKRSWEIVQGSIRDLEKAITEAEVNSDSISPCLIIAQKLNNQFDYIETEFNIPNDIVSEKEFSNNKIKRDELYKRLYRIFDKITNDEMVGLIKGELDNRVARYKMQVEDIPEFQEDVVVKIFMLRDEIKYLYDELDIWTGRWADRKDRIDTCDIRDKFCQEIGNYDQILKDYVQKNIDSFKSISRIARNNLINPLDGSKRFDFWWWYIDEIKL